jgi:hypothetical protein
MAVNKISFEKYTTLVWCFLMLYTSCIKSCNYFGLIACTLLIF